MTPIELNAFVSYSQDKNPRLISHILLCESLTLPGLLTQGGNTRLLIVYFFILQFALNKGFIVRVESKAKNILHFIARIELKSTLLYKGVLNLKILLCILIL